MKWDGIERRKIKRHDEHLVIKPVAKMGKLNSLFLWVWYVVKYSKYSGVRKQFKERWIN